MINKNEWSLRTFTEKDINLKILSLPQLPHSEQNFTRMLSNKQTYERQGLMPRAQAILKVLNIRPKRTREEQDSSLCSSCYEPLASNRYWCRICGGSACKKCIVRQRELKEESRIPFCQKCDQQYLQAMSGITFFNQVELLQKALARLVKEQEGIEDLLTSEQAKAMSNGHRTAASELAERAGKAARLVEENRVMKTQCQELQKKLQFGRSINKDLKKKLHALRKRQKESFGSVSNNDECHPEVEPPKLELDMSLQNIRESLMTTEERRQDIGLMEKCKCLIY